MLYTASDARDIWYMDQDKLARTVPIDTLGVAVTDFQITRAQCEALFESGVAAAKKFLGGDRQGSVAGSQSDASAPVALRPASASFATSRPDAMAIAAHDRTLAPVASPVVATDPSSNTLTWNTLAIVLVRLAILAVPGLLVAVMTGAAHLG